VSVAWQFYFSTLMIYLAVDVMAVWGLNLQFGVAGISSFAFIVFQAAGAYTAAVLTLGPAQSAGFQQYVGGANLPFPLPVLAAAVVGALLAGLVGLFGIRRLRSDYQAMVMLVISLTATYLANNETSVVNGPAGLSLVPKPLAGGLGLSLIGYQWFYVGLSAAFCVVIYWFVRRFTGSPLGRAMRAVRDNEQAAAALGKNVFGRVPRCVVARVMAVSRDVRVLHGDPGRRHRQQHRRRGRCAAGPDRFSGVDALPPQHRLSGICRRAAVDRGRRAGADVPVVLAAGSDTRAQASLPAPG
jgi:ABC-type branched-subunit amino acid transport system permease subunit